ncbi:thymidylate synthase [Bacillus phage SP-15]|uniref:Thymidylate synthase n=1 Tax=Bacillus phage SP-15 TaxID=1792032 RepID=A0A127AW12_9CAUD|nr:thymidylate synthase [Bacillus phage SP-15]AMM44808.1 thymidylate synthase [Bacillus phage SP-15]
MTKLPDNAIPVLDLGYVRLKPDGTMGNDLSVVNAARASYLKESTVLTEGDIRLIKFLLKHSHTSPFRQATAQLEIKAPLMVARQWFKYRVGHDHGPDTAELVGVCVPEELQDYFFDFASKVLGYVPAGDDNGFQDLMYARNEASRRYVTMEPEFYIPQSDEWRSAPENSKQGSGAPIDSEMGSRLTSLLESNVARAMHDYQWALDKGVCAEQARLFLPAYSMYTVWVWTFSLQGAIHFLAQRLEDDAQYEIQLYAKAVLEQIKPLFPVSVEKFMELNK